ncbi:MAG: hypothetical protein OXR07_06970, partial [Nitrospira sp.]|nr:hypothetical protein [Nitrospira sp.]
MQSVHEFVIPAKAGIQTGTCLGGAGGGAAGGVIPAEAGIQGYACSWWWGWRRGRRCVIPAEAGIQGYACSWWWGWLVGAVGGESFLRKQESRAVPVRGG